MATPPPAGRARPARVHAAERAARAMVLAAVAIHVPGLRGPIVGEHAFRQSQTAMTTREFARHGIDLLHPRLPVLGRPWVFAMELPLFQAIASLLMRVGLTVEAATRLLALVCFAATAWLLRSIATRVVPPWGATSVLAVFLFCPYGLHWSSTGLIEYLATAGALGCVVASLRWAEGGRSGWIALAALLGAVTAAVKVTTAAFWLVPAVVAVLVVGNRARLGRFAAAGSVGFAGVAGGAAWTWWADRLKAPYPLMAANTSSALRTYNFGTLPQRLRWSEWTWVLDRLAGSLLLGAVWIVPAALVLFRRADRTTRLLSGAIAVATVAPILTFFNLYRIHSYYLMAVSPGVAFFVGVGIWHVAVRLQAWSERTGSSRLPAIASGGVVAMSFVVAAPSALVASAVDPVPPLAAELRAATRPDEPVGMIGFGWNPTVLLYADRPGAMMNDAATAPAAAAEWRSGGERSVMVLDPWLDPTDVLRGWAWLGAVSPHVIRIADHEPTDVRVRATASRAAADRALAATAPGPSTTLRCDGEAAKLGGPGPTTIVVSGVDGRPLPSSVRVGVDGTAAFPGPRLVRVASGRAALRCTGAPSIRIAIAD